MKTHNKPTKKQTISKAKTKIGKALPAACGDGKATYKIHLKDAESVRRLLSVVINELRTNKISESKAKTIGYLSNVMLSVLELTSIEDRIKKLEKVEAIP